jgi:hypothetical protein
MKDEKTVSNQRQLIRTALNEGKRVSAYWGFRNGILRLGARIWELRHLEKMPIQDEFIKPEDGNAYKEYFIKAA